MSRFLDIFSIQSSGNLEGDGPISGCYKGSKGLEIFNYYSIRLYSYLNKIKTIHTVSNKSICFMCSICQRVSFSRACKYKERIVHICKDAFGSIYYFNLITYTINHQQMSLKQQRIQIVQGLVNCNAYPYLNYEPFSTEISGNYTLYSNEFMSVLLQNIMTYGGQFEYFMTSDEKYSHIYSIFKTAYEDCYKLLCNRWEEEQKIIAQQHYQMMQYQQQQQQLQGGYQNGFPSQSQGVTYSGQEQDQQQYQHYQQNRRNSYNQEGSDNRPYNNRRNNNSYGQNNNGQQFNNNTHNNGGQYQNQNYPQQGNNNGSYLQNGQNRKQNNQKYGNNQGPNSGRYQPRNQQQNQGEYESKQQEPQTETLHIQEAQPEQKPQRPRTPSPPPKPEPKPMKYSFEEIRQYSEDFGETETENVNPELIKKIAEVNSWRKSEITFVQKQEKNNAPKFDKKQSARDNRNQGGYNQGGSYNQQQQGFNKGGNYKASTEADLGKKKPAGLMINLGGNETVETKNIKNEIKSKAGKDFASMMQKEDMNLDEIAKAKKEIIYNLNLLAPENIRDIKADLEPFLGQTPQICKVLVEQIIEKAWGQPKYASTYAKLSSDFSKAPAESFKFHVKADKKDSNPFKLYLISNVQHSFDKKVQTLPEFQNDEEKENFLKATKKKILGNVKFIAELIRSKVLRKRILKICISQLMLTFLTKYYNFRKTQKLEDSYFDYFFEAVIEFIENVGDFYEKMDEPGKTASIEAAQKVVNGLIDMTIQPPEDEIIEITDLSANDYFKLFELIDNKVLKKVNKRLSALLLNLEERRENKWEKHLSEADGPKKLKDIKDDIAKEEQDMSKIKVQKKANLDRLNDLVKTLFKNWESDTKTEKQQIKLILKEYTRSEFYSSYLSQLADEKKEKVRKRLLLFEVIQESYFNLKDFQESWLSTIKELAFSSSDFPFCGSALALTLCMIRDKDGLKLKDFYLKTDDEDEEWFMNEVYDKFYHYTQLEEIKDFCEPSKKVGNMLEKPVKEE